MLIHEFQMEIMPNIRNIINREKELLNRADTVKATLRATIKGNLARVGRGIPSEDTSSMLQELEDIRMEQAALFKKQKELFSIAASNRWRDENFQFPTN